MRKIPIVIALLGMLFLLNSCGEPQVCKEVKNADEYLGTFPTMNECLQACAAKGYFFAKYVTDDPTNTCRRGCGCMKNM